jgi:hypothetical protein
MPTSNAPDSTVYNTFVDCMRRGASVRLTLRNGEVVDRFRTHDIIAPTGPLQLLPDMGKAKVRGVSRPDHEASVHSTFSLHDIVLVEDERLALPYMVPPAFPKQFPPPDGWERVEIGRQA